MLIFNRFLFFNTFEMWNSQNKTTPGVSVVKNLPANAGDSGDMSLISESRRSPWVGKGNPLLYSCLGRGLCQATIRHTGSQRVEHNWARTHTQQGAQRRSDGNFPLMKTWPKTSSIFKEWSALMLMFWHHDLIIFPVKKWSPTLHSSKQHRHDHSFLLCRKPLQFFSSGEIVYVDANTSGCLARGVL